MKEQKDKRNFRVETAQIAGLRLIENKPRSRRTDDLPKKKAEELINKLIEAIKSI